MKDFFTQGEIEGITTLSIFETDAALSEVEEDATLSEVEGGVAKFRA